MRHLLSLYIIPFAFAVSFGDEPPAVTVPRATSGDTVIEPDWAQRLTITVGPGKADQ